MGRLRRVLQWSVFVLVASLGGCLGTATTPPTSVPGISGASPTVGIPKSPGATAATPTSAVGTPTMAAATPGATPTFISAPAVVMIEPAGPVGVLAWSPKGDLLAGASDDPGATDTSVYLWKADGTLVSKLAGHTKPVTTLDWSPDGSVLASGSRDGTVRLWTASGKLIHTIDLAPALVFKAAWSPDGKLLAVASIAIVGPTFPGTVQLYTAGGQLQSTLAPTRLTGTKFFNLAWSSDGSLLVGGAVDYAIWHRDGSLVTSLELGGTPAWGMALSSDGTVLAISDENGQLFLYDGRGQGVGTAGRYGSGDLYSLAFAGSSHLLAAASHDVELLTAGLHPALTPVQGNIEPQSNVAWSPDGRWLAAGAPDKTVRVWRSDGSAAGVLSGCNGVAKVVAWSPDGRLLTAGTDQDSVCLWHWQP